MKRLTLTGLALGAMIVAAEARSQQELTYDRVDLSASASLEMEQDLLIAVVFSEVEDNDQSDAADAVNTAVSWAAERARRVDGIDVQTTSYSTRPLYANGRRITGWVARQGLRLESEDAEALSELLGELQERVAIQSIRYGISREVREAAEETLIARALAQFNRRADLIAAELGRDGYRLVRLNVGNTGGNFIANQEAFRMRVSAADAVAPPEIDAGTETLTVMVNGQIELEAAP
jgi:predicted secreted protein